MKLLLTFMLLIGTALGLPDAPSTSQPVRHEPKTALTSPCGSTGCWDYDHPNLSIKETFKSKHFYIPIGLAEASYWSDVGFSLTAIHRGCTEGNPDLPARPVLGQYFENWAKTELPLDILQWSLVKLNRKPTNIMTHVIAMVRMGVHGNGIYTATQCR